MMTFTDDNLRWVWVYFLKHKNQAFEVFKSWLAMVENEFEKKLKVMRCDGGGEYINAPFKAFFEEHGIQWEITSPQTPEQNGLAEHQNRTIVEGGITNLIDAELPLFLWPHTFAYFAYIKNRTPTAALPANQTPYILRYNEHLILTSYIVLAVLPGFTPQNPSAIN